LQEIARLEAQRRHQQRLLKQMDERREMKGRAREELVAEGRRIRGQRRKDVEGGGLRMGRTGFLRAFDKTNGKLVWERPIDATPHGTPMTCLAGGKQYIVLAVGGMGQKSELLALALP